MRQPPKQKLPLLEIFTPVNVFLFFSLQREKKKNKLAKLLSKKPQGHAIRHSPSTRALTVQPAVWMCAALWTWWEGEKFPLRQAAWITARERDDACLPLSAESHELLSGFAEFPTINFLQVIQRDWGETLKQRMLSQVIRILYVLSFCFFQRGFIRWGALTSFILMSFCSVLFSALHQLFNHQRRRTYSLFTSSVFLRYFWPDLDATLQITDPTRCLYCLKCFFSPLQITIHVGYQVSQPFNIIQNMKSTCYKAVGCVRDASGGHDFWFSLKKREFHASGELESLVTNSKMKKKTNIVSFYNF